MDGSLRATSLVASPRPWRARPRTAAVLGAAALLVALTACDASTAELAPLDWRRVAGPGPDGAVLGLGSAGAFDQRGNFTVRAFRDGAGYRLYYGGSDATGACAGINGSHWRIGLAESTDGITWTRVPGTGPGGA